MSKVVEEAEQYINDRFGMEPTPIIKNLVAEVKQLDEKLSMLTTIENLVFIGTLASGGQVNKEYLAGEISKAFNEIKGENEKLKKENEELKKDNEYLDAVADTMCERSSAEMVTVLTGQKQQLQTKLAKAEKVIEAARYSFNKNRPAVKDEAHPWLSTAELEQFDEALKEFGDEQEG